MDEFQVLSVNVQDGYPQGLSSDADVHDVHCDDVASSVTGVRVTPLEPGCVAFVWGRKADGTSIAVRVEGVRPCLFYEMDRPGDCVATLRRELEAELPPYMLQEAHLHVTETTFCHFYGYERDENAPSGRMQHRYAVVRYPSLKAWRHACNLRLEQDVQEAYARVQALRVAVADGSSSAAATTLVELQEEEERFKSMVKDRDDLLDENGDVRVSQKVTPGMRRAHERFVDPTTRFLRETGLCPTQWTSVPTARGVETRVTTCDHEVLTTMQGFVPNPDRRDNAPYAVAHYDIETLGTEPLKDPIIMISLVVVQEAGGTLEARTKVKYGLSVGPTSKPTDGSTTYEVPNEQALLLLFRRLLVKHDPDLVTTFNGSNFDNRFLAVRASELHVDTYFYQSRFALHRCHLRELKLSSSGMGDNLLRYLNMPGRTNLDFFVQCKRILTQEPSYGLDHLGHKYGGVHKNPIASGLEWRMISDAIECDPAHELTELPGLHARLTEAGLPYHCKFSQQEWLAAKVAGRADYHVDLYTKSWIRCGRARYRPFRTGYLAIADLFRGTPDDRRFLLEYCVVDSDILDHLDTGLVLVVGVLQFARTFCINPEWVYFRGEQVRFVSQLVHKARVIEKVPLLLQRPPGGFSGEYGSREFVGATVIEPVKGLHKKPVGVLDFASLYPTIMIDNNLCHSTLVLDESLHALPGVVRYDVSESFVTHFASERVIQGVLPTILQELGVERKHARAMAKRHATMAKAALEEGGEGEAAARRHDALVKVWDCGQKAIKVAMNSIYGACGAKVQMGAKYPCLAISATVTHQGRQALEVLHTLMPVFDPKSAILYGDTDSIFLTLGDVNDVDACGPRFAAAADHATQHFRTVLGKGKMLLEFEKAYYPFLIQGKKRYVGVKYEPDDAGVMVLKGIDAKGVETQRRDTLPYVKIVSDVVQHALLHTMDEQEALRQFRLKMDALVNNLVPMEQLTLRKNLSGKVEGKTDTIAHARVNSLRRQRAPGSEASRNEQVEYVIVNGHKKDKTTSMAEDPVYAREQGLKLNRLWYFEHCIKEAIGKYFGVCQDVDYAAVCREYSEKLNAARLGINTSMMQSLIVFKRPRTS